MTAAMQGGIKRVFHVRYLAHPIYSDILARRPDVRLDKLENDSPDEVAAPILAGAHAYQIGSARDELAPKYHADRDLLRRAPNLLIVSTGGAGYDTVNVAACTDAGVLVVNQSGGNREAVAEHVLGMMLCCPSASSRPTGRCGAGDRAHRPRAIHGQRHAARPSASSASGMSAAASRNSAAGCSACRCSPTTPISRRNRSRRAAPTKVDARRPAGAGRFRVDQLPAHRGDARHDRRARIRADAAARLFHPTARGHIHDEAALADALREKRIAGAGLDVWDEGAAAARPSAAAFDNVLASPHTAGVTLEARRNMGRIAAEQILGCARRQAPAAHRQSGGVAALRPAVRTRVRIRAGGCEGGDVTYLLSCHPGRARSARAGTHDPQCRDSWIPDRLASLAVRDDNGSGITD